LAITFLHETAHLKISYFYNKSQFCKKSPIQISTAKIDECGEEVEKSIFGGIIDYYKVKDKIADKIVNPEITKT